MKKRYPVEMILDLLKRTVYEESIPPHGKIILDGYLVRINTKTLKTFLKDGVICRECGMKGQFFRILRDRINKDTCYLRLYGVNNDGNSVMMTRDHIYPKSRGGKDAFDNLQTMCANCNIRKGDKVYEGRDTRQIINQDCQHEYALQYN